MPMRGTWLIFFFLMIRRPPRSTLDRSSAASDVYKRQVDDDDELGELARLDGAAEQPARAAVHLLADEEHQLSLIHISEPTRPY